MDYLDINFEEQYVCNTYNKIANEFSNSRYKVWDSVFKFISELPKNSEVLEVGCGNGKNLLIRNDLNFKGCDISEEFIKICKSRNLDVIKDDITNLSFSNNSFDNTLSVAVIHHMVNEERRLKAISELIRITKPNGQIFIEVWAMEQDNDSRIKFEEQDNLVPFKNKHTGENLGSRFYHIFKKGELEKLINNFENV
jgi:SAM-dependent methyltransferase